jgi:hypothetical protein
MSDGTLFFFGLIATLLTLGPLIVAAVSEMRDKGSKQK